MNRKDKIRYKVAQYMVDDEGISEDGHVCDERWEANLSFKLWITNEVAELKNLLQELMELAVKHGKE